jgi:uncharacterized Zn finger protein
MMKGEDERTKMSERGPRQPIRCVECGHRTVVSAIIAHRSEILHEGNLYPAEVAECPVLKCRGCGTVFFTNDSSDAIEASLPVEIREARRKVMENT